MEIYEAAKDIEMTNIGLDTCEYLFGGIVVKLFMRHLVLNIRDNIYCFSLKELWQLLIMEHGIGDFYNRPALSFSHSILFRIIGHNSLFLDTFLI